MSLSFDRRITPIRDDVAAAYLKGQVEAKHFLEGTEYIVAVGVAPVRQRPAVDAPLDTELLWGERFTVYDVKDGWAWGQSAVDGYVGYVPQSALEAIGPDATHRVITPSTHLYPAANIKRPPHARLSLGAQVCVLGGDEKFLEVAGGFVPAGHLALIDVQADDFVAVAEQLVGVPYLWGGRSSSGLDCSALVQLSLAAAGVVAPRDADMQEAQLGTRLGGAEALAGLKRGDLIFWKGHVAIAIDSAHILHANAWAMAVAIEPVDAAVQRITATEGSVTAIKRL